MSGRLSTAEEIIDKQATTELFQGREIVLTTGRVLLHALDADERALCGQAPGQLNPTRRPWDDAYLAHIPRCPACVSACVPCDLPALRTPRQDALGVSAHGRPAAGVDVRAVHATDEEKARVAALRAVLAQYDLRRWMFTDLVRVDGRIRGGFSHPLTISPHRLLCRAR